ncbi:N-acetylmuramic acid 6-phosphate etherase [Celeribacter sp.]|uniref:N-acetylmuramic acid 6-phosphate etherase n=1 Tax=Celeribacter sp. TaxID=1890673 RepID=UPI003A8E2DD9
MPLPTTEALPEHAPIDARSARDAALFLLRGQQSALAAVEAASDDIIRGAQAMVAAIRSGHSVVYGAAGSSGLMALADACELPGTFGVSPDVIRVHMAGGIPVDARMPGDTEDDTSEAARLAQSVHAGDAVIVLSASGTTPYAVTLATGAKARGATVIAIANNPNTPLLLAADVAICLQTPPEVIAGSTRLGAGTAQKSALNMMSSLMGVGLGHVYRGLMVNVVADNAKLVARSANIVAQIAGVPLSVAEAALAQVGGHTKLAILVAAGSAPDVARTLLDTHNGCLGPCLQSLADL